MPKELVTVKNHAYWVEKLDLKVTQTQRMAMAYLERKGYRFMIDFGTDNAIEKATEESESGLIQ